MGNLTVSIIGLGYVGLPLALTFAESNVSVIGIDIDPDKVLKIENGKSYLKHIEEQRINKAVKRGLFKATSDFSVVKEVNAIIICVPTPLNKFREPDLTYIINTMEAIKPYLKKGQLLSLESTTYPGTTDELLKPMIESMGFTVGENFYLVYSPEREDPGNKEYTTKTIPKVIGGCTAKCLEKGINIYGKAIDVLVPVKSPKEAELTKLLENIYRAVNIGLVNELKIVADKMGIDIWNVIEAASTKPFGFTPFYPGPGLGGHCIPIDPFYLTWKAKEYGINTKFIELAGEVNTAMPSWVISKVSDALNNEKKAVKGSKILILGLAYKKITDDARESPAVEMLDILVKKGANVDYYDPYIPEFPKMRNYKYNMKSIEFTAENLKLYDCVIIATDHDIIDYEAIRKHSSLVIDTRGRYKGEYKNIVKC